MSVKLTTKDLDAAIGGLGEADVVVERAAQNIKADAKRRVAGYDPRLGGTIRVAKTGPSSREVRVGSRRRFEGHLVEWGSVNNAAHPFMGPAVEAQREPFRKAMRDLIL